MANRDLINDIRSSTSEIMKLSEQVRITKETLQGAGINQAEWDAFLKNAGEPALWEEDR